MYVFLYVQVDKYIIEDLNNGLKTSLTNRKQTNNTKDDWDIVHNAVSGHMKRYVLLLVVVLTPCLNVETVGFCMLNHYTHFSHNIVVTVISLMNSATVSVLWDQQLFRLEGCSTSVLLQV